MPKRRDAQKRAQQRAQKHAKQRHERAKALRRAATAGAAHGWSGPVDDGDETLAEGCGDPTCPDCYPPDDSVFTLGAPGSAPVQLAQTSISAGATLGRPTERPQAQAARLLRSREFESDEEANAYLEHMLLTGGKQAALPPETDLERAQELIYDAWEETNPRKQRKLAENALVICADCADAYVLLGNLAETPDAAARLYQQGMAAGERALGEAYFQEDAGEFWHLLETRGYMRARSGLAEALWYSGKLDEAAAHFRELLRLNPEDTQGNRAMDVNSYVPFYVAGTLPLSEERPRLVDMGDLAEAEDYALAYAKAWAQIEGALDWLADIVVKMAPQRR